MDNQDYDVETQLFYCNSRYYSPALCRWISPDSIDYLDSESINGLNLYCYCMNSPIIYIDNNGNTAIIFFVIMLLGIAITATILSLETPNAETTGLTYGDNSFMTVEDKTLTFVSIGGSVGRKDWCLNEEKTTSFYFSGFNLGASFVFPKDQSSWKNVFQIDASIFKFGYNGKYFDLHIALGFKPSFITIDLFEIYEDLK